LKLETVKAINTPRTINVILLNIETNQPKLVDTCGYKLATNLQNFTEIIFSLSKNDAKSFRGEDYFFVTHTVVVLCDRVYGSTELWQRWG